MFLRQFDERLVEALSVFLFPRFEAAGNAACKIAHDPPSTSASVNSSFHVHSRAQDKAQITTLPDHNFYRNTLYNFDEVAGGILRGQQRLPRTGRTGDGVDDASEIAVVSVDMNVRALTGPHVNHLCFFEVRG